MGQTLGWDDSVKMELEPGQYKANLFTIKRPTGKEKFPVPDVAFVWQIAEGDYLGMEIKQNFRTTVGTEEQNAKGIRKLNKTIEILFGEQAKNIPDEQFFGKKALISVFDYKTADREGVYVSGILPLNEMEEAKAEAKPANDFDDEVVF